ncbi:11524_t:CDS:2, partial [Funneliformis mosseae]
MDIDGLILLLAVWPLLNLMRKSPILILCPITFEFTEQNELTTKYPKITDKVEPKNEFLKHGDIKSYFKPWTNKYILQLFMLTNHRFSPDDVWLQSHKVSVITFGIILNAFVICSSIMKGQEQVMIDALKQVSLKQLSNVTLQLQQMQLSNYIVGFYEKVFHLKNALWLWYSKGYTCWYLSRLATPSRKGRKTS